MWAKDVDFSSLKQEEGRHLTQETISFSRTKLLAACAIHYDLHIPSVIRYLSGEYMAEFRNAFEIDKLLESRGCPSEIRQDLFRIFKVGCPNKLQGEDSRQNFIDYWKYRNHSSIDKNVEKVLKVMNKEYKNSYLIPFPSILC